MAEETGPRSASGSAADTAAMSTMKGNEYGNADWLARVADGLRTSGYFYDPVFSLNVGNADSVVLAARRLGSLFIPSGADSRRPVILTQPSIRAPRWRPFDRRESIGWHNDFSTWSDRPELSLSLIRRQDPSGPHVGAWRVASVEAILSKLRENADGRRLFAKLSRDTQPFGYPDAGSPRFFHVVSQRGIRFYGTALTEGARTAFGRIPDHTMEAIALVEDTADAVGETLQASTGALLIAHNWLSLHDRTEQTIAGGNARRQARLCFVKKVHRPLFGPRNQVAMMAGAQAGTR